MSFQGEGERKIAILNRVVRGGLLRKYLGKYLRKVREQCCDTEKEQ